MELENFRAFDEKKKYLIENKAENGRISPINANETGNKINFLQVSATIKEKEKEILALNTEIKQRDFLLEKARNLVITLNEECNKKTIALKNLEFAGVDKNEGKNPMLIKENEFLKDNIQGLKKNIADLQIENMKKEEYFNSKIDAESFGSRNSIKNSKENPENQIENDITYLTNKVTEVNAKLNDINTENTKLNEYIIGLETKFSSLQKEKEEIATNLIKAYETIEDFRHQKGQLDLELKKIKENPQQNQNLEDLSKLLIQKETLINELSSQALIKAHKHKKHRHNSSIKEIFEITEAIKQEIIGNKTENLILLNKESFQTFKDFQI